MIFSFLHFLPIALAIFTADSLLAAPFHIIFAISCHAIFTFHYIIAPSIIAIAFSHFILPLLFIDIIIDISLFSISFIIISHFRHCHCH